MVIIIKVKAHFSGFYHYLCVGEFIVSVWQPDNLETMRFSVHNSDVRGYALFYFANIIKNIATNCAKIWNFNLPTQSVDICIHLYYNIIIKLCQELEVINLADKKLIISAKKYVGDTAVVSARLPSDLIKRIDEICEVTGRNRNEVIQMCLEFAVDNIEIER